MQLYLNKGLVQCTHINLEKKKLIDATSEEFAEYFETLDFSVEHNRKILMENFKKEYDDFEELKLTKFTRWLKEAGRIKSYRVSERKSGSERFISYSGNVSTSLDSKGRVGQMDSLI